MSDEKELEGTTEEQEAPKEVAEAVEETTEAKEAEVEEAQEEETVDDSKEEPAKEEGEESVEEVQDSEEEHVAEGGEIEVEEASETEAVEEIVEEAEVSGETVEEPAAKEETIDDYDFDKEENKADKEAPLIAKTENKSMSAPALKGAEEEKVEEVEAEEEKEEEKKEEVKANIFALRTTANREDQVMDFVSSNSSRKKLPVYSVIRPHGMRGYIFLEAQDRQSAEEAVHGIPYARGLLPNQVQYSEIEHMLEQVKKDVNMQKNDIVEIISGAFKREKAKVTRIDKAKEEVVVELLEAAVPIPITLKIDSVKVIRRPGQDEGQEE